jgi:hypothetical protein
LAEVPPQAHRDGRYAFGERWREGPQTSSMNPTAQQRFSYVTIQSNCGQDSRRSPKRVEGWKTEWLSAWTDIRGLRLGGQPGRSHARAA